MNQERLSSTLTINVTPQGNLHLVRENDDGFPEAELILSPEEHAAVVDYVVRQMQRLMPHRSQR